MSHELRFRRLFRRLVLCAAPLPLVVLGIACGDASESPAQNGEPLRCSVPAFSCATCEIIDKGTFPVEIDAGPVTLHGADCTPFCGRPAETCMHDETDPTGRVIVCSVSMCSGRRPSGLAPAEVGESTDLGSYFASMACLEAASVEAFRTLARELTLHGAPRALVRTARRAARDEIRHTRITRALARRHGGALREPRVAPTAERSLQAMATENASKVASARRSARSWRLTRPSMRAIR